MIQFEEVSKFGLSNVNLHIPSQMAVGLIGESGAGKTTMLKLACGLLAPDVGRVHTLSQEPIKYRKKYGKQLGVRFAGIPVLSSKDTIKEGYSLIGNMYHMSESEFKKEYDQLSEMLGFRKLENEQVKNLSLGQRARAELGTALLTHPKVLLLDEPTIGLDQEGKKALWNILKERIQEGMTLLVSSHDMREVTHLCDRVAFLHKGHIEYYGDLEEINRQYENLSIMKMRIIGKLPDLGDLPLHKYIIENDTLTLIYSSNFITSSDVLEPILKSSEIAELTIKKAELEDIVLQKRLRVESMGGNDGRIYRG